MTHSHVTRTRFCLTLTLLIALIGGLIIGCQSEDESAGLSGPTLSVDEASAKRTEFNKTNPAQYTPGTEPGIAVTMDFSEYHIAGQPYGDWMLHASWRACRKGCPELVTADVQVTIEDNGQGSALIPASFLNQVFQLAQQKYEEGKGELGVWWNDRALVLDLLGAAAGETLEGYYDVDLGQEGYTYSLSAGAMAGGLQQILDDLGIGWYPGKGEFELTQDLMLALDIGRCIGVTETPTVPVSPTLTVGSGLAGRCDALCAARWPGSSVLVMAQGPGQYSDSKWVLGGGAWEVPGVSNAAAVTGKTVLGFANQDNYDRQYKHIQSLDGCRTEDGFYGGNIRAKSKGTVSWGPATSQTVLLQCQ